MSFTSKNLQITRRGGLSVLKGATLFFLGMSCVMFLTRAYFTITPEATNARQVIESIFLSLGGDPSAVTGISLDGAGGNAYFAGKIGIGVSDPSMALQVSGTGKFNGVCLGGDCRSTWPTAGGNSVWSTGSNKIYYNSGNVGIGTNNPTAKLDVKGSNGSSGTLVVRGWGTDRLLEIKGDPNDGEESIQLGDIDGVGASQIFSILPNKFTFINGDVGIGTPTPSTKLDVNGGIKGFNNLMISDNDENFGEINTAGNVAYLRLDTEENYFSIINDNSTINDVKLRSKGEWPMVFGTRDTERMRIREDGNVGIATSTPTEQFQIGNYAWIGQNTGALLGTGGRFLRIYGDNPTNNASQIEGPMTYSAGKAYAAGEESDYAPNIQLNYRTYNSQNNPAHKYYNWKMVGDTSFGLRYSTGPVMPTKMFSISPLGETWVSSKLSIGTNSKLHSLTLDGNIRLMDSGYIAASSSPVSATNVNQLFLGTNGNVGIGTPTPATKLQVSGPITAQAYYYESDERLKTDITAILDPLQKILNLNGYMFTWKDSGKKDMGVIAQEVEQIFPEIVNTNTEGYKSVEYGNLVAPLIEAVKTLNAKVDAQAKEIETLKAMIK